MGNIARDGGKPKTFLYNESPAHGGMHSRTRQGDLIAGATQTTANNGGAMDAPDAGKRLDAPTIHPGMKSKSRAVPTDADHRALAQRILNEAALSARGK